MAGDPGGRAVESRMIATREQLLVTARRAALAAGEAILAVYATAFDVQHKTDNTPVCEGDLVSERIICAMLTEAFPGIPIASEELVAAEGVPAGLPASGSSTHSTGPRNSLPGTGNSPF